MICSEGFSPGSPSGGISRSPLGGSWAPPPSSEEPLKLKIGERSVYTSLVTRFVDRCNIVNPPL